MNQLNQNNKTNTIKTMKNLIIGLDSADWDVMTPLLKAGKLPNIQRFMDRGAYGKIKSHITYGSPALWATIDTGKVPPRHGVKDFFTTTRNHVTSKRLFEILEGDGGRVGLYKWYCTWPIVENRGFTVPSWLTRSYEAFPSEYSFLTALGKSYQLSKLINVALKCLKSGVSPVTLLKTTGSFLLNKHNGNNLDKIISDNFGSFRIHSEAFMHLMRKYRPNYGAYLISLVDSTGHRFWKYREPHLYPGVDKKEIRKYGGIIDKAYIESDYYIGRIADLASLLYGRENFNLLIVSDHGQKSINETNDWGYFPRTGSLLEILGLTDDVTASNIGNYIYLSPKTSKHSIDDLKRIISGVKTSAGNAVFLLKTVEKDELLEVRMNTAEFMEENIVIDSRRMIKLSDFASPADKVSGDHAEHGILIMNGPDIKENHRLEKIYSLEDIAPTMLYLNDKPVGEDMDGRPAMEIFKDEFTRKRPVEFIKSYDADVRNAQVAGDDKELEVIKERLKGLGYFS